MTDRPTIRPQPGPQTEFLKSSAFITLYGGQRGGGKSYGILMDSARHVSRERYRAVMYRRTFPELTGSGSLWEEAEQLYPLIGGTANESKMQVIWPAPAKIHFRHFQDRRQHGKVRGLQWDRASTDEASEFEEDDIWAIIQSTRAGPSRVSPRLRLATNPPGTRDHWMIQFVEPYLTADGYADRSKSGEVRWFLRGDDGIRWVPEGTPHALSFTFIPSSLEDNKILTERDPGYEARLMNLVSWERDRMLHGNWYASPRSGMWSRDQCRMLDGIPSGAITWIRYWDQAGTEPSLKNLHPDHTAGALLGLWHEKGALVLADVTAFQKSTSDKRAMMVATAQSDGREVPIAIEQEPGSTGKESIDRMQTDDLLGYTVLHDRPSGDKSARAAPWLAWLETGKVYVVRGPWNGSFFNAIEHWPPRSAAEKSGGVKDIIDAVSGGFSVLTAPKVDPDIRGGSATGHRRAPTSYAT